MSVTGVWVSWWRRRRGGYGWGWGEGGGGGEGGKSGCSAERGEEEKRDGGERRRGEGVVRGEKTGWTAWVDESVHGIWGEASSGLGSESGGRAVLAVAVPSRFPSPSLFVFFY